MARKILNFKVELEKIENERKRNIMTKQLENDYSSIVAKQQILFSVFDYIMENSEHRSEEYIISQEELKEAFIKGYRDAELRGLNTVGGIKLLIEEILKKSNKT